MDKDIAKLGFWSSLSTSLITLVTFIIAVLTPPLGGPYCTAGCYTYPYLDIAARFPRDYYWMYPAILLVVAYFVLMTCLHFFSSKKIFSFIAVSFALISMSTFFIDYFLQVSVIQPSLLKGESDGVSMLSQFNPHGTFIALEEVGFFMMSLSFLFMSFIFTQGKLQKAIRWIFQSNFLLTVLFFIFYSIQYGIFREYRFEVATISINWLTLIVSGILTAIMFRRSLRELS